jgi:hypothetical protein
LANQITSSRAELFIFLKKKKLIFKVNGGSPQAPIAALYPRAAAPAAAAAPKQYIGHAKKIFPTFPLYLNIFF